MVDFVKELTSRLREENSSIIQETKMMMVENAFFALKTDDEREKFRERMFVLKGRADQLERVVDIINSIT